MPDNLLDPKTVSENFFENSPMSLLMKAPIKHEGLPEPQDDFSRRILAENTVNFSQEGFSQERETYQGMVTPTEHTLNETVQAGFNVNNSALNLYKYLTRKFDGVVEDPTYNLKEHHKELTAGIPLELWHKFDDTNSLSEARQLRQDMLDNFASQKVLQEMGFLGTGAALLGGLVDLDTLAGLAVPAKLAMATKAAMPLKGAAAGAVAGMGAAAVTESAMAMYGPTGRWSDVPGAILGAGIFSAGMGSLSGRKGPNIGMSIEDVGKAAGKDLGEEANAVIREAGRKIVKDAPDEIPHAGDAYVGREVFAGDKNTITERAREFMQDKVSRPIFDESTVLGRAGKRFTDAWDNSGVGVDFDRMWNSDSPTMKAVAYSLFESPEGVVRNNISGAMQKELLNSKGLNPLSIEYHSSFDAWAKENGYSWVNRNLRGDAQREFDRAVQNAVNEINMGRTPEMDAHITKTVDALRNYGEFMRKEAQGPSPSHSVPGFETLEKGFPVYFPQRWNPEAVRAKARELGKGNMSAGKEELSKRIAKAYELTNPNMNTADSLVFGKALVNRMSEKGLGIDTNLQSLLHGDGKGLLRETLLSNGMHVKDVDEFFNRLSEARQDKGKVGNARARLPIDMNLNIDGLRIGDLVNQDIMDTMYRYHDTMSGRIALSRYGIHSRDQAETIKSTIMREIAETGVNKTGIDKDFLDYAFSYFQEGPIGGGIDPWARRAKAVANLSLLNKLGITQLQETGPLIAAVGLDSFRASSPILAKWFGGDRKIGKQVSDELGWMAGNIGYERGVIRTDILENMRSTPDLGVTGAIGRFIDDATARGQNVQGLITGYFKIVDEQTRLAALSMTDRIFRDIRDGKIDSLRSRLSDMGLTAANIKALEAQVANGNVKFNQHGFTDKLGIDSWTPELRDAYAAGVTRFAYQFVQRALPGEGLEFSHSTFGSLLLHLQTFALTAIKKQAIRNAATGDFLLTSAYGLASAGLVSAVKATVDGKYENLTPLALAKSAFSQSNNTGWLTYGSDPLFQVLGLTDLQTNGYGKYGGKWRMPAVDTMNNLTHLPSAILGFSGGSDDIRALKAIPLIGNYLGAARVFDSLKRSPTAVTQDPARK